MSSSIRRRRSSKEGLQNLIRVTAQRSIEDAEELERERRRRAREKHRDQGKPSGPLSTNPPQDNGFLAPEPECEEEEVKPRCQGFVDEDEGFSDWSHRLEKRKKPVQGQEALERRPSSKEGQSTPRNKSDLDGEEAEQEEERGWQPRGSSGSQGASRQAEEKICDRKKEVLISCRSTALVSQEAKNLRAKDPTERTTSTLKSRTINPSHASIPADRRSEVDGGVSEAALGRERRPEESYQRHRAGEEWDAEEFGTGRERHLDTGNVHRGLEKRCRVREAEAEYRHLPYEEESPMTTRDTADSERSTMEASQQTKTTLSLSGNKGTVSQNPYGPMGPTFKISETATDPLSCAVNKSSNRMRRSLPPIAVSKIDNRVENYTHAIQVSSNDVKAAKPALTDLPSPTEPVSSKKSLFEAGDAWSQNPVKTPPSKDAEGIKVGVADLINQWVKGSPESVSGSSPSKPAEIKPGDVLSKKNLWENLTDTTSPGRGGKGNSSGKRHRFVVTGHGKYEKVADGDQDYSEYASYQSAGHFQENL